MRYTISVARGFAVIACLACNNLVGDPPLPAGLQDPTTYSTPTGAMQLARGTITAFHGALPAYLDASGEFTDELTRPDKAPETYDERLPTEDLRERAYNPFHAIRGNAQVARAMLRKYAPEVSPVVTAELYAIDGYSEILLADLYCSGIPLSTVDFQGDFTYHASSTTADVYRHAGALLDSALTLSADTGQVGVLARVGLGRALLALGLTDSAARVVASVPTVAKYAFAVDLYSGFYTSPLLVTPLSVANRKGRNGLAYTTTNDPRISMLTTTFVGGNATYNIFFPAKYAEIANGLSTSFTLADGIEARLIQAEADLRSNGTQWLAILNALRTDGTFTVTSRTDVPGLSPGPVGYPDTAWGAGSGIGALPYVVTSDLTPQCVPAPDPCTDTTWYRGLPPLTDPGLGMSNDAATTARVSLLFRERAFWLFLTGHRISDLRRLVRAPAAGGYGRAATDVYPVGTYRGSLQYNSAVTIAIPESERINPLFHGCLSSGA